MQHYKDRHNGGTAVVYGTGPSLARYDERFNDGAILIGTNEIVYHSTLMDYYFIGDAGGPKRGYLSDPETYNAYKPRLGKFVRRLKTIVDNKKPPELPDGVPHAIYYAGHQRRLTHGLFPKTIPPFADALSITFDALQFALLVGVKRIYLVGHDCDYSGGTFHSPEVEAHVHKRLHILHRSWLHFKGWHEKFWPGVEIINVNPVRMQYFNKVMI